MDIEAAHKFIVDRLQFDGGKFFGGMREISIGAGVLYTGVRFPVYDELSELFATAEGAVYVLTHECDIDQKNERIFNELVLICPIIDFAAFVVSYREEFPEEKLKGILASLAQREVSRVVYIPQHPPILPYGGLLYLNQITHAHVSAFARERAAYTGCLTRYGLSIVDYAIQNHLLRPKVQDLPLSQY